MIVDQPKGAALSCVSTAQVGELVNRARAYIARNHVPSASTPFGQVSPFWRDVLRKRPGTPTENDVLAFRRSSFAYGIGEDRKSDDAEERAYAQRVARIIGQFVPRAFLESLSEPAHGAPLVYDVDGLPFSASFRTNAGTAYRVYEILRRFSPNGKQLRVCEIGPGWGACAIQLHQILDVALYVMVDVPENLFLSSTYLGAALPGRALEFLEVQGASYDPAPDKRIVAMLPSALSRLSCHFDLIVNSFSLQEMDAETVDAYLDWANRSLSENGLFISFNSHGKADITRGSEYRFSRFDVRHIRTFRRLPTGFFNTIPYEVVLQRPRGGSASFDDRTFGVLADMLQLGLDDELAQFHDDLVASRLSHRQQSLLQALDMCFSGQNDEQRETALMTARSLDDGPIVPFTLANLQFAKGAFAEAELNLETALEQNLRGFAKLRCEIMRAVIRVRNGGDPRQESICLPDDSSISAAAIYPEISGLVGAGDPGALQAHINRVFRRAVHSAPHRHLIRRIKNLISDPINGRR